MTSAPASSSVRIVAALTARERRVFFAPAVADQIAGWHWLDDASLTDVGWAARLRELGPTVLVSGWNTPALPPEWLDQPDCPLRLVCHVTGSVRRLVPRRFLERGGIVTNWGETVSVQVAEQALLLALAALRQAGRWREFIAQPMGPRRVELLGTRTLVGRRVGIHGFGSIARALVRLLQPFGVTITAHSPGVPPALLAEAGVKPAASLAELFAQSEVLFECEALTAASELSVNAAVLAQLPNDAVFVNVGRGRVVDEDALLREATSGRLRVALDVVTTEPLTAAAPLAGVPHVILSPHIGGPTFDRYPVCGANALENLAAFLRGTPPPSALTLPMYDRAT